MSTAFEVRLHQLGQCMHELFNQAQYLQELFVICLEDYRFCKEQSSKRKISNESTNIRKDVKHSHKKSKNRRDELSSTNEDKNNINANANANANLLPKINTSFSLPPAVNLSSEQQEAREISGAGGEYIEHIAPTPTTTETPIPMKRQSPEDAQDLLSSQEVKEEEPDFLKEGSESSSSAEDLEQAAPMLIRNASISRKKAEPVFVKLTLEEKERILYDWIDLGTSMCERKWGINHGVLIKFNHDQRLFKTNREREIFKDIQRERLYIRLANLRREVVYKNAEISVRTFAKADQFGLVDLCDMAYDRGIAIIGARFHIDLFEFEYLLKDLCGPQWERMEDNHWFCTPRAELTKLEIVKLSQLEGVDYAAKKTGESVGSIYRIRQMFEDKDIMSQADADKVAQRKLHNLELKKKKTKDDELITF